MPTKDDAGDPGSTGVSTRPTPWTRIGRFLDGAKRHLLNAAAIVAVTLVVAVVLSDVSSGNAEVEPIDVPPVLGQAISGDAVAAALRDGILSNWRKAIERSAINVLQRSADQPDITISGTNLQLRYVANLIRRLFGRPVAEFSGRLALADGAQTTGCQAKLACVRLTLRESNAEVNPYFDESGPFDVLLDRGARATLAQIDPIAAILAYAQGSDEDKKRALRLAVVTFGAKSPRVMNGRALLAEAIALYALSHGASDTDPNEIRDSAAAKFQAAIKAYQTTGFRQDRVSLAYAYDGLALLYFERADWEAAKTAVEKALFYKPNYDSAIYHKIQIDDRISRYYFDNTSNDGKDAEGKYCDAEKVYEAALAGYGQFIRDNPGFSVAYTELAVMSFQRLHWLRTKSNQPPPCAPVGVQTPQRDETSLRKETDDVRKAFEQAIFWDDKNPAVWFQFANFLYEEQDPQYLGSEPSSASAFRDLLGSVAKYRRATALEDWDFYVWYRFGEALYSLLHFDPKPPEVVSPSDAEIVAEAVNAYCRSAQLNKSAYDTGLITSAHIRVTQLKGDCRLPLPSETDSH